MTVGDGGTAPLPLPEFGHIGVEEKGGVDMEGDAYRSVVSLLHKHAVGDWGGEMVLEAVLNNATDGPNQSGSIADRYWGMRWDKASGTLQGVLKGEDVAAMPENHFVGVEEVRSRLCQQVEFLLNGLPVSNCHLWGPPGVGKSSCVFSLLGEFGGRGLRLLEVDKESLTSLPEIFELIGSLPQKFIVFCDDLSFEEHESEVMRAAKASLEGSLRKYPSNIMVLITSNRRYPVGSRSTDSTEEKMAFTNRFGVILAFPRMSRAMYLSVVHKLCESRAIIMPTQQLEELALTWALGQDGNSSQSLSGRTARQFADHVESVQSLAAKNGVEATNYLASSGNAGAGAVPANSMWASSSEGAAKQQR